MKAQALILVIVFLIIIITLACIGSQEVHRMNEYLGGPSGAATATSAAQEFHVQLTLTASEAAVGLSNSAP